MELSRVINCALFMKFYNRLGATREANCKRASSEVAAWLR